MKLSDTISDYLNHIRHERGLAQTTCEHYASWLHHFTDWLFQNGYPDPTLEEVFTVSVLRRYQRHKAKSGIRPRTIHSAFHSLRGMGEYLRSNGLLKTNPVKSLTLPKKDAAIRLTVTDEDVRALFDVCDRLPKPRQIALARAVLSVLCYGGLRRQETCDLTLSDIDLIDKSLLVRSGKGSKSRRAGGITALILRLRQCSSCAPVRNPKAHDPRIYTMPISSWAYRTGCRAAKSAKHWGCWQERLTETGEKRKQNRYS